MNNKAEYAATKILLAFEWGGICPLEPEKFAKVRDHVSSILNHAMETEEEKKARKWARFRQARNESNRHYSNDKDAGKTLHIASEGEDDHGGA